MSITLPSNLQNRLKALAECQGKDITSLVVELLSQSLTPLLENNPPKTTAPFMRFAGIAGPEASVWIEISADVEQERALNQHRSLDL